MTLPDPVALAIPAFIGLMLLEIVAVQRGWIRGEHELRDSAASLSMGFGYLVVGVGLGFVGWNAMVGVASLSPFDLGFASWTFVLVVVVEDFAYYWFHRLSHEHRLWWAAHINHHSSQHLNLTTALRQAWTNTLAGTFVVWLPLAFLGFPPALVFFQKGVSLVYQFWIHTEAVGKLPRPIEWLFNTPSHHRVHHATNPRYLDRNYAGIFVIWDRLFGTFVPEDPREPCRYGLTHQIATFNPVRIAFHEWWAMLRDVARARSLREAAMYVVGPPGWSPDGSRRTAAQIRAGADRG